MIVIIMKMTIIVIVNFLIIINNIIFIIFLNIMNHKLLHDMHHVSCYKSINNNNNN